MTEEARLDPTPLMLRPEDTLHTAMSRMTETQRSIVLVTDDAAHLLGIVVDGDVRRALLNSPDLSQPVSGVMTRKPRTARIDADDDVLFAIAETSLSAWLPLVDADNRVRGLIDLVRLRHTQHQLPNAAVLMAGGLGTRLRPYTETLPKPMVPVGGRPILETIILRLATYGFRRFHISVNYLAERIINHFGDGSAFDVSISYLHEDKPLGTAGGIRALAERETHPMLVMNGDILTNLNPRALIDFHKHEGVAATVAVREYLYQVPFGVVQMDDHRLTDIEEKPVNRMFINAGLYVVDPALLGHIPAGRPYDMPDLLRQAAGQAPGVACYPISEYWTDIGQIEDLHKARDEFSDHF